MDGASVAAMGEWRADIIPLRRGLHAAATAGIALSFVAAALNTACIVLDISGGTVVPGALLASFMGLHALVGFCFDGPMAEHPVGGNLRLLNLVPVATFSLTAAAWLPFPGSPTFPDLTDLAPVPRRRLDRLAETTSARWAAAVAWWRMVDRVHDRRMAHIGVELAPALLIHGLALAPGLSAFNDGAPIALRSTAAVFCAAAAVVHGTLLAAMGWSTLVAGALWFVRGATAVLTAGILLTEPARGPVVTFANVAWGPAGLIAVFGPGLLVLIGSSVAAVALTHGMLTTGKNANNICLIVIIGPLLFLMALALAAFLACLIVPAAVFGFPQPTYLLRQLAPAHKNDDGAHFGITLLSALMDAPHGCVHVTRWLADETIAQVSAADEALGDLIKANDNPPMPARPKYTGPEERAALACQARDLAAAYDALGDDDGDLPAAWLGGHWRWVAVDLGGPRAMGSLAAHDSPTDLSDAFFAALAAAVHPLISLAVVCDLAQSAPDRGAAFTALQVLHVAATVLAFAPPWSTALWHDMRRRIFLATFAATVGSPSAVVPTVLRCITAFDDPASVLRTNVPHAVVPRLVARAVVAPWLPSGAVADLAPEAGPALGSPFKPAPPTSQDLELGLIEPIESAPM